MIFTIESPRFHPFMSRRFQPFGDFADFMCPGMDRRMSLNALPHLLQFAAYGHPMEHEDSCCKKSEQGAKQQKEQPKQDNKFEVKMNVKEFKPEELNVKMVDNCIVVEGKHEEKDDDTNFVSRHFVRRFTLPKDVKPEAITCNLGSDGILNLSAPRMIEEKKETKERPLPINVTSEPALATSPEADQGKQESESKTGEEKEEKMDDSAASA